MKSLFAALGIVVAGLWLAATLGLGHFALVYGPNPLTCEASHE